MKTIKKKFVWFIIIPVVIIGIIALTTFCLNCYVKYYGSNYIISLEDAKNLDNVDCMLVLGCQVNNYNGNPSIMLADRLLKGIELYKNGTASKIIMSGDHGQTEYDEVNVMKKYAMDRGVLSQNIFMDHAGVSTYESLYRAKEVFQADKIVIVTQKYHLYRAIYIARKLGIDAYGVPADNYYYVGQTSRETREILARVKDFVKVIFKPKPTFLGNAIPVSGDGNATND